MFAPQAVPQPPQPNPGGGGIAVTLPAPGPEMVDGAMITRLDDGGIEVDLEPEAGAPGLQDLRHDGNLAEVIDETILAGIADEICEGIEADIESNREWHQTCERGVELLGIKPENRDEVFKGACGDFHPLVLEAVLRGQANARAEMLPAAGPVRTEMLATTSAADADQQKSVRKQQWLNYYLTSVDEAYYPDFDQMLLYVYVYGSTFKKVYTDPLKRRPAAPFILPKQLIMSYTASDVGTCGRVTHEQPMSKGDVIRMQLAGVYRDISLAEPTEDGEQPIGDKVEGRSREYILGDDRHTIWECHCDLDIPVSGIEHVNPKTGERSGLPLPYVVTIDKDSRKVLALRRNWAEGDADFSRLQFFVHYKLMPGLGVYGWGYAHVLAASGESATKLRRCLLDAALLANFPGGFKRKGIKEEQNNLPIGPCEFRDIDTGEQPIGNVIMPLPYKEPGAVSAKIMEEIVQGGQRIGNTMDMAVGDGREDAPVGTTLALIEKATRPESAIIKRLHAAHRKELRLLAACFADAPEGTKYPYKIGGQAGVALAEDFKDAEDIVPVSDPNISTQTQRLAIAQAKLTLATQAPQMHDMRQAYLDIYRVMGLPDADINRIMPPPSQAQPMDPIAENMAAVKGSPLAVGPTQNHAAHGQVHLVFMQTPGLPQHALQALAGHIADHLNAAYRQQMEAALGQPLPPPGQPLPPQIEYQLSVRAAQVAQQVAQTLAQMVGMGGGKGQDPAIAVQHEANQVKQADIQAKQADSERKAEESARQDQVELIKQRNELADNAADRASQERIQAMQLEEARIHSAGQARQHQASLAGEVVKGVTAAKTARLGVVSELVKGHSAVAAETAKERTEHTKGKHAVAAAKAAPKPGKGD